ncbi:MAG: sulfide/dihydroorotate dehydrogenase-like FAD/NAD-binding protein [Chloroflexi bacterium]|nr:sulfide/dihydroorotate dehydrogenase-like FAD/NAD-binding protein [Chloroflexota bacterium]
MYRITAREDLAPVTKLFVVEAPEVARKCKSGQFVIVRVSEHGERVPLTIADYDRQRGELTIVFQVVGKTTAELSTLGVGDSLASLTGPLGLPTEIEKYGTVVMVGGGVGIAPIFPIARDLKEAGNYVIGIIGARTRELLFWEDRMRTVTDELIVCTDDGSYARKALVTEPLKELCQSGRTIHRVWGIGPAIMMKFVSLTTKPFGIQTIVSLNSIMVDGTGMCGACRVVVGGRTRFCCVHGPEFDGHEVDWDLLMARQRIYLDKEKLALERYQQLCEAHRETVH